MPCEIVLLWFNNFEKYPVGSPVLLAGLAVLGLGPELGNLGLNLLLDAGLQLRTVAQGKEDLEPDEHGREEESLDQVVQECGGAFLESAMADELGNPADDVNGDSCLEGQIGILSLEVVAAGHGGQAEGGQAEARHGL